MIVPNYKKDFNLKIRDLYKDLGNLYKFDNKIRDQNSADIDCIPLLQSRFTLININAVLNYSKNLTDHDFFFFRNSSIPISELTRLYLTKSVYKNLEIHNMCYIFFSENKTN